MNEARFFGQAKFFGQAENRENSESTSSDHKENEKFARKYNIIRWHHFFPTIFLMFLICYKAYALFRNKRNRTKNVRERGENIVYTKQN